MVRAAVAHRRSSSRAGLERLQQGVASSPSKDARGAVEDALAMAEEALAAATTDLLEASIPGVEEVPGEAWQPAAGWCEFWVSF